MRKTDLVKRLVSIALCSLLLLTGCQNESEAGRTEEERFEEFSDELFKEDIVENTINLHYTLAYPEDYGITDYEVSLGDFSIEELEDNEKELKVLKKELEGFDRDELNEEQQMAYDLLMDYVEMELEVVDLTYYYEPLSPLGGYQAQLPILLAEYTFRNEQDVKDYLALLPCIDDVFEDILVYEEVRAEEGLFMADFVLEAVLEQCEEFIENPEDNYLIEVFNDKIDEMDELSEEEKEAYKEQHEELVLTEVVGGYELLIDGLEELEGSGENELGMCYLEDGERYYEYLVKCDTGSDSTVEELEKRIERYLENCEEEMYSIFEKAPDVYYELDTYEYSYTDPEDIMEDLIVQCEKDFPAPPEVDYTIKYVHESMEEHTSPAFYLTPPIDDTENNVIYVNNEYVDDEIYTMIAHEGYPGHLYQTVMWENSEYSLVRNLFSYPGYTEGWATYTEMYAYDISGLSEPMADLLSCDNAYSLAVSAYIDIGVNYEGWDVDDVEDYLADLGIGDAEVAQEIFEAVVEEPANYLRYFVGYIEIVNLRNHAKEELGDDFDLKEFHGFMIEVGPAPFYLIEERMYDWIEEQQ
ncbi:MAG: DUF885 domain-containing protein [Lachnospiraceae bacterium]|nr:DUF885 domain-containing protein [Lachnospiraceae bacterium]